MRRRVLSALALLPLLACDASGDSQPAKSKTAEQDPNTDPQAKTGKLEAGDDAPNAKTTDEPDTTTGEGLKSDGRAKLQAIKAAANKDSAKAKAGRESLGTLLNDGRKAVKDKNYDEGIALYRKALKLDPINPKVLGELGFAALRKGDLKLAESSTRKAIEQSKSDKGLGAMYYNLGRIEESRGDHYAAMLAYEHSLKVRPGNKIVAGRLAEVRPKVEQSGPDESAQAPGGAAAALCKQVQEEWECYSSEAEVEKLPEDEQEYAGLCDCTVDKMLKQKSGASALRAAATLHVTGSAGSGGEINAVHLAIQTQSHGWQLVGVVANSWIPGVFGINNEGEVESFAFRERSSSAPGQELHLVAVNSQADTNLGINTVDFEDCVDHYVCFDDGGQVTCLTIRTKYDYGSERMMDDEPVDKSDFVAPEKWAVSLGFAGDTVTVKARGKAKNIPDDQQALIGTHSFADFAQLEAAGAENFH